MDADEREALLTLRQMHAARSDSMGKQIARFNQEKAKADTAVKKLDALINRLDHPVGPNA